MSRWPHPLPRPPKRVKPLGPTSPWVWSVEPVHGCNLRCGHCNCRLDPLPKTYHFMEEQTWLDVWKIAAAVLPTCRSDLCVGGEPTLHPSFTDLVRQARALAPLVQIQVTTNGTQILSGRLSYRELFEAGINIVYTDMYGPHEDFRALAEESGYPWYEYYAAPEGAPSPWTYWGPALKLIVLQEPPDSWPASRMKAGLLGTWYNHLDWEAAKKYGLAPVTQPLTRRCNQPFLYVTIDSRGNYLLCCQDNTGETSGLLGNVRDGVEGFRRYWYGEMMQATRRRLRQKDRAGGAYCSRCCVTWSRGDFKHWTDQQVGVWWDGKRWLEF